MITPADEPDIPMLDVGDFEVLDECVGEDDNEEDDIRSCDGSYYEDDEDLELHDHRDNPKRASESVRRRNNSGRDQQHLNIDENSADNGDNILDVSIDVENDFLESVAKDFSESIEEEEEIEVVEEEERPRTRASARLGAKKPETPVSVKKKIVLNLRKDEEKKEEVTPVRKRPGPKSKTLNSDGTPVKTVATPVKKPIQKINFSDDKDKKVEASKNANATTNNNANANAKKSPVKPQNAEAIKKPPTPQKIQPKAAAPKAAPKAAQKTPAFLKKDLTDEEILEHFDEIENSVLTSECFIIENESESCSEVKEEEEEEEKEKKSVEEKKKEEKTEEEKEEEKKEEEEKKDQGNGEENQEENWDEEAERQAKKQAHIKIEEEEFAENELWYKDKVSLLLVEG